MRPAQADTRTGVPGYKIGVGVLTVLPARPQNAKGEWVLVVLAWDMKRMFALTHA